MFLKSDVKERIQLFIWAIIIFVSVPFLFENNLSASHGFDDFEKDSSNTLSAEDVFAEDGSNISLPENASKIISADLSGNDFDNQTRYQINKDDLVFIPEKEKDVAVLIIHTYATQSYSEEGYITNNSTLKSENENLNVLCAGEALANELKNKGITVIHEKTMFDKISYSNAYSLSIEAVKNHTKNNPKIKYVIDIQRGSVFSQSGNCIKAVTNTKKGKTAQIGFKSGCDENGADFPDWKTNLSLSYALSEKLCNITPKLSMGVTLLPSGYGQYSSDGFITIEIGTAGNTPEEAKNAAALFAEALCDLIS